MTANAVNELPPWARVMFETYQGVCRSLLAENTDLKIKCAEYKNRLELLEALGVTIVESGGKSND